ncbi:MAG: ATP-binding cassette domain-containing protein [Ilumatobacteraceae bacterium]
MIEIDDLSKRYGHTRAVDHLSFTVHPGRVTGFLGPSGSGKSTTMRMILGLDHPTTGSVRINRRPYTSYPQPIQVIGALLDAKAADAKRTAASHLRWLAYSNGIPGGRVREVLSLVGLDDVADAYVGTFSLGMYQRLGIAVALLGDPQILMFDEPLNGLDAEGIIWLRTTLKSFAAQGRTILLSSHLMSEIAQIADHLVVIGRGRLLADAPAHEIVAAHASTSVVVKAARISELAEHLIARGGQVLPADSGAVSVTGLDATTIGAIAAAAGIGLDELTTREGSLEQAFLDLTHGVTDYRAGAPGHEEGT